MSMRFCYDPSQPISENDHVLLMDHVKRCFVVKVERNKYVKICKDKFKIETLIGLHYGVIFTKVDNVWIKVNKNDDSYRSYWDLLQNDYSEDDDIESHLTNDNRNLVDSNTSQKLSADDIIKMKKNVNTSDLITTIVQNSQSFQSRSSISKEKYIRRKEFRHLKLFEVRHCSLFAICESYFDGFPHKIGYLRFESLGIMLHTANVQQNQHIVVFDHSLGLITGAVAQRLQGTGKIYRLVTRGVTDKLVHELGINYFDNILSVDYEEVIKYCSDSETILDKPSSDNVDKEQDDYVIDEDQESSDREPKKRKKDTLPGIYPLNKITQDDLLDLDLLIGNVSFNKCIKNNSMVDGYTLNLVKIADKFLKQDGRFIVFGQHFQPLAECYSILTKSNQYINVRLDETFMREYQVKPMCTHPIINKCRPCCGFILSAIKISHLNPI